MEARTLLSTYTVTSPGDANTPGTLRYGLMSTTANTINFDSSVFTDIIVLSDELPIPRNVKILGPGADNLTISGPDFSTFPPTPHRIFDIGSGLNVTISGLALVDGIADSSALHGAKGGAIYDAGGGALNLSNDVLARNEALGFSASSGPGSGTQTAGLGGAVYNVGSRLTVDSSTFTSNSAGGGVGFIGVGGAIYNAAAAPASQITNDTFSFNEAIGGGGDVSSSRTSGNGADGLGGAVYNAAPHLTIDASGFTHNDAFGGGGISSSGTAGNGGDGLGGAVYNAGDHLTIHNSTFAKSQASLFPDGNTAFGGFGGFSDSGTAGNGGVGAGGAIYNAAGAADFEADTSSFTNESAFGGGGGNTNSGTPGNGGDGRGGAVYDAGAHDKFDHGTFSGDNAMGGEGGFNFTSSARGNGGNGFGGGFYNAGTDNTIDYGIFTNDSAFGGTTGATPGEGDGGAIFIQPSSTLRIKHLTLANNKPDDVS